MIQLWRIVEFGFNNEKYSRKVTSSEDHASALDLLLERSKPVHSHQEWDPYIFAPFRYSLPVPSVYSARFRPPYFSRNVFYGSFSKETSFYESSYHFMKERVHLNNHEESGHRSLFSVNCDISNTLDICKDPDVDKIMSRSSYEKSYTIANLALDKSGIVFPSCRDPEKKECAAMYEISCFEKNINTELSISFKYSSDKSLCWYKHKLVNLTIHWEVVA